MSGQVAVEKIRKFNVGKHMERAGWPLGHVMGKLEQKSRHLGLGLPSSAGLSGFTLVTVCVRTSVLTKIFVFEYKY